MASSATRQAAIDAGNSATDVDAFIAHEGGDRVSDQRLGSAFNVGSSGPPGSPGSPSSPSPTSSGAPGGGSVVDSSDSSTTSALSGLTGALGLSSGAADSAAQIGSQPAEQAGSGLRQNLGNRLYPTNTNALAGLQRAY